MLMNRLRNSASSLLIVALATPAPVMAQTSNPFEGQVPLCSDGDAPCVTEGGMVRLLDGTEAAPAEAAAALGIALPAAEAETVVTEQPAADAPIAEAEAPVAEVAPEVAEEKPVEAAPVEPAQTETAAEPATPTEAPAQPEAEAAAKPAPAQEAPAVEAEQPQAQASAPAADAPTETVAEKPEAVTPAEPTAAAEAPVTEAPATEAKAPVAPSEGQVAAETPADAAPMTEAETAAQAADEAAAEAQVATEAAPAAAATQTDAETKVTSETVTAEDVRSSDEEFATKATGDAAATAKTSGKGLSNFEKVLLLGAGALAVGAILKNGDKVVSNSGDRVVVDRAGQLVVLKDDDSLLRQPGNEVQTETFNDGSTRTTVARPDGTQVVTIRAADGRVLRRARVMADGTQYVLFDDTRQFEQVDVSTLPAAKSDQINYGTDDNALRAALAATSATQLDRSFSLSQIRNIRAVRDLAPEIELTNVTFASGSAAITPSEAEELSALGRAMTARIAENPREVFLIEGHTDAVGNATYNLALSDRRAESLALALTEYFDVPPENMVVQGYGERYLKVRTPDAERANRRAVVRVITPLLGEVVATK